MQPFERETKNAGENQPRFTSTSVPTSSANAPGENLGNPKYGNEEGGGWVAERRRRVGFYTKRDRIDSNTKKPGRKGVLFCFFFELDESLRIWGLTPSRNQLRVGKPQVILRTSRDLDTSTSLFLNLKLDSSLLCDKLFPAVFCGC
jgi:hypothetical protein